MKNNEILRAYGTDYKNMTKALLDEAGLAEDIRRKLAADHKGAENRDIDNHDSSAAGIDDHEPGADGINTQNNEQVICRQHIRIGIKPNLVSPTPADFGGTTHPEIIAGIIEYLTEHSFSASQIEILEGSWVGDKTSDAFEYCGYNALSREYGAVLRDMQKEKDTVKHYCGGLELEVCSAALDLDYLINVPVLKGHCQTKMTCALKNMKGLIPNTEKRRFHRLGLHKPIAYLNTVLQPDLIVTDHICGDPDFEEGGNPLVRNCIMVSKDPVLTDTLACRILGVSPDEVRYLMMAEDLGIGSTRLDRAQIRTIAGNIHRKEPADDAFSAGTGKDRAGNAAAVSYDAAAGMKSDRADTAKSGPADGWKMDAGVSGDPAADEDDEGREPRRLIDISCAVEEIDSCSACYGTLLPALERIRREGHFQELMLRLEGEKIGIGQGYRGKQGRFGVGSCTSCFEHSVKGCPPDEETIYRELKGWI